MNSRSSDAVARRHLMSYMQVWLEPEQYYAIHVEIITQEGNPCRLSISNVYDAVATQASSDGRGVACTLLLACFATPNCQMVIWE